MLDNIINEVTHKLYTQLVQGEFYIGLNPIKEFVKFHMITNYIQKEVDNESISIYKYVDENFVASEEIKEDDLKQTDTMENKKWRTYERKLDHYNTLNFEKKIDLLKRQRQEKSDKAKPSKTAKVNGNVRRYQGNELYKFQLNEFKILDGIKEGRGFNLNRTYKRINSEKGYLNKMNFREFQDFIGELTKEIDESESEYKNIRYYKLEKRLNFELTKSIVKAINKCRKQKVSEDIVLDDLITLFKLPLIKERQKYAEIYPDLDNIDRMKWRFEIDGIFRFIQYLIIYCESELKEKDIDNVIRQELESFKNIYNDFSYKNDYKIKKDFTAEDFLALMKKLDDINIKAHKQVNEIFSI